MLPKKFVKSSTITRLLIILNASGLGSKISPPNLSILISIDNSAVCLTPDPSGPSNIPLILVNGIDPVSSGDSISPGSSSSNRPSRSGPSVDPALHAVTVRISSSGSASNNTTPARPVSKSEALRAMKKSANKFSLKFFRRTGRAMEQENLVVSAVSAWMVLAMVTYGARGYTEEQMRTELELPEDNAIAKAGFRALIDSFENYEIAEMHLANKIFIKRTITPKAEFRDMAITGFRSAVQNVNFAKPAQAARIINKWCKHSTNNRIEKLFSAGQLDPTTAMVLVNAVYFKGKWETPFNANKTVSRPFHINLTATVDVPMMFNKGIYRTGFIPNLKARFIEIPYKSAGANDALSMFIVMPRDADGLPELEKHMHKLTIERLSNGEADETNLFLPKFKIKSDYVIDPVLHSMNLRRMFDIDADFTGISDSPLSVTQVIHKAFIEVSEEGTEAAASTGFDFGFRPPTPEFDVNHPFIGFIGAPRQDNSLMLFSFRWTGPASI